MHVRRFPGSEPTYWSCSMMSRNAVLVSRHAPGSHSGVDTVACGCHEGTRGDVLGGSRGAPVRRIGSACHVVRTCVPVNSAVVFSITTTLAPRTTRHSSGTPTSGRDLSTITTILVGRGLQMTWCAFSKIRPNASGLAWSAKRGAQSENMPSQVQSHEDPVEPINEPSGSSECHWR
jgi:hypothetical protein